MLQYTPMLTTLLSPAWVIDGKKDSAGAPLASHNLDVPTGSNGGDSAMVLAYLQARHKRSPIQADVLLLNCGLHDIKTDPATGRRQVDLPQYIENLEKIMEVSRTMKLQVIWVRITPVIDSVHNSRKGIAFFRHARDVHDYNEAADAIMARHQAPVVNLHDFSRHFIPEEFVDHVHYNSRAQELQAAFISGHLNALALSKR
jgi:lysophospholipase L1-like esterase